MGKDFATNLGLNYQQVMIIGVALVSIMSATVVMIVGQLPFLGLIVPNLVSLYYGDNLRKNIPRTAIFGAMFVLLCDLVGRVIIFPYEVPHLYDHQYFRWFGVYCLDFARAASCRIERNYCC